MRPRIRPRSRSSRCRSRLDSSRSADRAFVGRCFVRYRTIARPDSGAPSELNSAPARVLTRRASGPSRSARGARGYATSRASRLRTSGCDIRRDSGCSLANQTPRPRPFRLSGKSRLISATDSSAGCSNMMYRESAHDDCRIPRRSKGEPPPLHVAQLEAVRLLSPRSARHLIGDFSGASSDRRRPLRGITRANASATWAGSGRDLEHLWLPGSGPYRLDQFYPGEAGSLNHRRVGIGGRPGG